MHAPRSLRTGRLAVAASAVLLVAALGAPSQAAGTGYYTVTGGASANGTSFGDRAPTGTPVVFSLAFSNQEFNNSFDLLNRATVTLPASFSIDAATATLSGATVPARSFTTSIDGQTVTAQASPAGALPRGETLTLAITATATELGRYTFATTASGITGTHTRLGDDPQFTTYTAVFTCAPNQTCVFPRVGPDNNTSIAITDYNGGAQDFIVVNAPAPVVPACGDATNESTPVSYETTNTTSTLDIHLYVPHKVSEAGRKDGSRYDVCWQQDKPFVGKGGAAAQQTLANARTEYFARLALCADNANTVPCITSVSAWTDPQGYKNGYDFLINGTAGDPLISPTELGLN